MTRVIKQFLRGLKKTFWAPLSLAMLALSYKFMEVETVMIGIMIFIVIGFAGLFIVATYFAGKKW